MSGNLQVRIYNDRSTLDVDIYKMVKSRESFNISDGDTVTVHSNTVTSYGLFFSKFLSSTDKTYTTRRGFSVQSQRGQLLCFFPMS